MADANLFLADLSGSDLDNADLSRIQLVGTVFRESTLDGTNFNAASVGRTIFADVDLSNATGLESVRHYGPSTLGTDTLYRSGGTIPVSFLRGCGSDLFVENDGAPMGKPINSYSCFISHSTDDQVFAERLYSDLRDNAVRCWYFPESAKWGEPLWGEIDQGIRMHDKLIVICSERSLQSQPVLREIERALQREDQERKNILFPITIDDYLFTKWEDPRKTDVLSKVVADFRHWGRDPNQYNAAFERLLKALQAAGAQ